MALATIEGIHDLVHDIKRAIGEKQVAFDDVTRLLYSTDASNYQITPVGVTFPRHADDVCAIHEVANQHQVPILPRGGGTSLAGQTVGRAIVMDFTRYMRCVQSVNAEAKTVQIEPGLVLDQLNRQLQSLGLMFGPDPASANRATLGGCLGNNASGTHSILYRMTADHVRSLDVVLASGEKVTLDANIATVSALQKSVSDILARYREPISNNYPKTWRTVAGYALNRLKSDAVDLTQLIVGSEGTLATIVGAELSLVDRPTRTCLAIVHFPNVRASLEIVPAILETNPSAVELLDKLLMDRTRRQPEFAKRLHFIEGNPEAILVVEYYGESELELLGHIERLTKRLKQEGHHDSIVTLIEPSRQSDVWLIRKSGLGLLASDRSDWKTVPVIEDAAVPVEHLADYIDQIHEIVQGEGAEMSVYAHASAGCLHVRPLLNLKSEEGLRQYRAISEAAVDAVLSFGGTTSGEHGEGLLRGEFSQRLFGTELTQAFREVKHLFDPNNRMNPNKVVDALPMDDSKLLRYGVGYKMPLTITNTRFDWSADQGFGGAIEMCNGAGVCRKENSGTMCPSFMATREERDSTRGRANILRLAMTGTLGMEGMQDERVKSVLDLCLSCKACKVECPSSVDMARLKAEFTANYQDQYGIPARSRIFANIHRLSRLGSLFPRLSNIFLNLPLLSSIGKRLFGIASQRQMPQLAPQRFTQWQNKENQQPQKLSLPQPPPILIVDTFTEYYYPEIGRALQYLMTASGVLLRVLRLPNQGCCGRPSLSKGLLDHAKKMAVDNVKFLSSLMFEEPEACFMMLEPSCLSAFRDDYPNLVPQELHANASEIADRMMSVEQWLSAWQADGGMEQLTWDQQPREIILHGHCHQKALWGTAESMSILSAIPAATVTELDAGCCGMAGSFGYESEHYDVSMKIAEQRLYPAVRHHPDAIIAASGTSCREQITHIQVNARHPVEILAQACGWRG